MSAISFVAIYRPPATFSTSISAIGSAWATTDGSTGLVRVPSVVVPEETNVLINLLHADTAKMTATKPGRWTYDARAQA